MMLIARLRGAAFQLAGTAPRRSEKIDGPNFCAQFRTMSVTSITSCHTELGLRQAGADCTQNRAPGQTSRAFPVCKRPLLFVSIHPGTWTFVVRSKEKIRDLCSQLLRAESPTVIQYVASQLHIAIAEFAIDNAMNAELTPVLADLPSVVLRKTTEY